MIFMGLEKNCKNGHCWRGIYKNNIFIYISRTYPDILDMYLNIKNPSQQGTMDGPQWGLVW